jgi:hypothetical protein
MKREMKNKWYLAAVFATTAFLTTTASWSQETSNTNENESHDVQQVKEHMELQKKIEQRTMAAHDAAQKMKEAGRKFDDLAEFKFKFAFPDGFPFGGMSPEIAAAAGKVRDAENESDKAEATKKLTEVVEKSFEDDLKRREQELAAITERVERLQAQLDRRRGKKQEIVDLQVKVAINDADGLGFYSQPVPPGDMMVGPSTWGAPAAVPVPVAAPMPHAPIPPAPPTVPAASSDPYE